eukprot:3416898-Karenia_brevis.AAC.1
MARRPNTDRTVWFACEEHNCSYMLLSDDPWRHQKKSQHLVTHAKRKGASQSSQLPSNASSSQPLRKVVGKTSADNIVFKHPVSGSEHSPRPTAEPSRSKSASE